MVIVEPKKKKKHSKVSNQEKTLIFKNWKTATLEWSSCNLSLWEWIISGTQYFIQIKKTSCFRVSGLFFPPSFLFFKTMIPYQPWKGPAFSWCFIESFESFITLFYLSFFRNKTKVLTYFYSVVPNRIQCFLFPWKFAEPLMQISLHNKIKSLKWPGQLNLMNYETS